MNCNIQKGFLVFIILIAQSLLVSANEPEGLKITYQGFIALEGFNDSTRTYTEPFQNLGISRPGTVAGDNGRTEMSARDSLLGIGISTPSLDAWHTRGYYEFDFNGYDPTPPGPTGGAQTEQNFFTAPTFRQRQAYLAADNDETGWHFLAGQYWQMMGWNPVYLGTGMGSGTAGDLNSRTPQIKATKEIKYGNERLQLAAAVARPSQRDSNIPNLDFGANLFFDGRKGTHFPSIPFSQEIKPKSMSLTLTGSLRQYETPNASNLTNTGDKTYYMGGGIAADAMIPIIPSSDGKEVRNNLVVVGEFATGQGISDSYFNWTGNLQAMNTGTSAATKMLPNLDAGQGAFDASNNFQLVQTQSFVVQSEYSLPTEKLLFLKGGYGQIMSPNLASLTGSFNPALPAGTVNFDKNEVYFINFVYQITDHLRANFEVDQTTTHYVDNVRPTSNRYELGLYYLFL